jgi:hypothetical protein
MSAPMRQSQADMLNKLYEMKLEQLAQATQQGSNLRCQVLEAEAQAIFDAIKSIR